MGLREGDRINNYLLEAPAGTGSFGEVWRARHHVFGDRVAIKIPTDAQYVRNLQREGVAVHGLKHPNIVRVLDLDPYATPPYLIMEYVDGPSLRAVVDALGSGFPIRAAVAVMRGVLQALCVAHDAGLVHRDIKPANILLTCPVEEIAAITEQAVKVTDFGLGRIGGATTQSMLQSGSLLTEEGRSIAGTLAYMAPEQKEGGACDGRSDLYSCGIVLFELLTGERPQGGEVPSSLRSDVPAPLDDVFRRAYTRMDRRFASAGAMLAALTPTAVGPPPPPSGGAASGARVVGGARDAAGARYGAATCPRCATTVLRDDQFCIRCGHQLVVSVPSCPACHAYVHRSDRFCIFCGRDLRVLA